MIIEIKDLPGRKVSRILVDVTFEDTGDSGPTTSQSVSTEFINETSTNPKTDHKAPETPVEAIVSPEIKRVLATNPGIPAEMRDMEF